MGTGPSPHARHSPRGPVSFELRSQDRLRSQAFDSLSRPCREVDSLPPEPRRRIPLRDQAKAVENPVNPSNRFSRGVERGPCMHRAVSGSSSRRGAFTRKSLPRVRLQWRPPPLRAGRGDEARHLSERRPFKAGAQFVITRGSGDPYFRGARPTSRPPRPRPRAPRPVTVGPAPLGRSRGTPATSRDPPSAPRLTPRASSAPPPLSRAPEPTRLGPGR